MSSTYRSQRSIAARITFLTGKRRVLVDMPEDPALTAA
jgi:hypothetical protein